MTDDDDGRRRTDDRLLLYYKLTLWAFGSGELIKFHFSEVHRSMNATSEVNFARDPFRSYFDESQKNENHLLYLHFVFTLFLLIICEILI